MVCGLLRFAPRNDKRGGKWWFVDCFALLAMTVHPHCHCKSCLQLVVISVILDLSLREPKVCGNLVILGLSLRGFEKAMAIHKKLKIEAQSGKMISLLNHFSLLSHKVRNERNMRN